MCVRRASRFALLASLFAALLAAIFTAIRAARFAVPSGADAQTVYTAYILSAMSLFDVPKPWAGADARLDTTWRDSDDGAP